MAKKTLPFLSGKKNILRPIEPESDSVFVQRWVNDPEVAYFMFYGQLPLTRQAAQKFLEEHNDPLRHITFMVFDSESRKEIGFAGLYEINWISRRAEFRILIGEKNFWGKGWGTEVTEMVTWFGFDRLNLYRIDLGVTAENKGAVAAYKKAGFEYEFTRKDFMYRNSRWYDTQFMVMFRERYYKKFFKNHQKKFGIEI